MGNLHCMAEKGCSKLEEAFSVWICCPPTWRKHLRCNFAMLQLGGSIFGADLSSSKLERRISYPICRFAHRTNYIVEPKCRFPDEQLHFPDPNGLSCNFWNSWRGWQWAFLRFFQSQRHDLSTDRYTERGEKRRGEPARGRLPPSSSVRIWQWA